MAGDEKYKVGIEIDLNVAFEDPTDAFKTQQKLKGGSGTGEASEEQQDLNDYVEALKESNVDDVKNFTEQQFGNVKKVAVDPFGFLFGALLKKFSKLARAGIYVGIALLIAEIVKFFIEEAMKPGRFLDRRFRRKAQDEIFLFNERKEQQELRQGFKEVRVTTLQGLRGLAAQGQVFGNLFPGGLDIIPGGFYDQKRSNPQNGVVTESSGGNITRGNNAERFPGGGLRGH